MSLADGREPGHWSYVDQRWLAEFRRNATRLPKTAVIGEFGWF